MKIAASDSVVERSGIDNETSFSIKASGKAFKILSDGLYSNKIGAIVRELSCNAYDSHIAAGKKHVPFEIHLPTSIEPWFSVKDFGTGLSHEDITNLYSTYFESTKNTSNDYVGAFGLGSKSPFCYVDSFTVVSNFAGMQNMYQAYVTEHGIPNISLLSSVETAEENGIEVRVPVKSQDMNAFVWEVKKLKHFATLPIVNDEFFVWDIKDPAFAGENWKIFKETVNYVRDVTLIQGGVAYPLDSSQVAYQRTFGNYAAEITFEIGELEVAASRESISYNKQTVAAIENRLGKVKKEFEDTFAKKINEFVGTGWEFKKHVVEVRRQWHETVARLESANPTWKSKFDIDLAKFKNVIVGFKYSSYRKTRFGYSYTQYRDECRPEDNYISLDAKYDQVFMIKDKEVPTTWIDNWFQSKGHQTHNNNIVCFSGDEKQIKKIIELLGHPATVRYSQLTKPATRPRAIKKITFHTLGGVGFNEWTEETMPETAYYVIHNRGTVLYKNQKIDIYSATRRLINAGLMEIKDDMKHVFFLTATQAEKMKTLGWVNLVDFMVEQVENWVNENSENFTKKHQIDKLSVRAYVRYFLKSISNEIIGGKNHIITQFLGLYEEYESTQIQYDMSQLVRSLSIEPKIDATKVTDIVQMYNKILSSYPMLTFALKDAPYTEAERLVQAAVVAEYIKLVDSKIDKGKIEV